MKKILINTKYLKARLFTNVDYVDLFGGYMGYTRVHTSSGNISWTAHIGKSVMSKAKLQRMWWDLDDWFFEAKIKYNPFPVYFELNEMDCDHFEVWQHYKFKNGWAAVKYMEKQREYAEGFQRWTQLTKKQYNDYQSSSRDHLAEKANY